MTYLASGLRVSGTESRLQPVYEAIRAARTTSGKAIPVFSFSMTSSLYTHPAQDGHYKPKATLYHSKSAERVETGVDRAIENSHGKTGAFASVEDRIKPENYLL